jgi:hypothetical protein
MFDILNGNPRQCALHGGGAPLHGGGAPLHGGCAPLHGGGAPLFILYLEDTLFSIYYYI